MSTIADPHDLNVGGASEQPVRLRLRVAVHRAALTRQLADGTDPTGAPELALLARQLTTVRSRRRLARALRSTVVEARRPALSRWPSIISRPAVLKGADALDVLVKRLHSPAPVTPRGMALVYRLVTDGEWSPLYGWADPGALRRLVILTTAALETADLDEAQAEWTLDDAAAFDFYR